MANARNQFQDVEFLYGFNGQEEGFTWTHFDFGVRFNTNTAQAVLSIYFPHDDGILFQHNAITGSRSYILRKGMNMLHVFYAEHGRVCEFEVSPRRALAEDVRELGVMLCAVEQFAQGGPVNVPLSNADDGLVVGWTPKKRPSTGPVLARHLLHSFVGPGVFMPYIEFRNNMPRLEIALFPAAWAKVDTELTVSIAINGVIKKLDLECDPDTTEYFRLAHLPNTAFRGVFDLSGYVDSKNELVNLDISWVDHSGHQILPWQEAHWRGQGAIPMPSKENIFRVAGPAPWEFFLFSGATWFNKLIRLYEYLAGRNFEECGPVLDWGIGCGRIARHFRQSPKLYGVDIDNLNIDWCRTYLPDIHVEHSMPDPPLLFDDEMFELVYGHSVMTHLSEADQHAWLGELCRVTKPGGFCLLTVLGELSWFIRFFPDGRSPDHIAAFLETGIADDGSLDVGVDENKPGAYRNISHTTSYVTHVWSSYFDVVEVIQGFADLQNLVVLRKR